MPAIMLTVEHLVLDNDNPRITHSDSQHETLQKVVKDQGAKLVRLAESIVEHGLSPIERLMVLQVSANPKRYVALEGNRRVAALRLLTNPAAMTGLEVSDRVQVAIERLARIFDRSRIEPIDCFEVSSREASRYWIELRHNGEDQGRGIVGWKPIVAARFRDKEPAIQALDMVLEHGGFSQDEADEIRSKFSLTTFRRFFESKDARAMLGLTIKDKQLRTTLPGSELIKPLKRIIKDIVAGEVESRRLNKAQQIVSYLNTFDKTEKPDLSKQVAERPVEAIENAEFARRGKRATKPRPSSPSERKQVVPKGCSLNVTDKRISEIYDELRTLKLIDARNAIAVLMRVFLELSLDHFLEANGISLSVPKTGGGVRYKELDKKLTETVNMLVQTGVPREHFAAVTRSLNVDTSPMSIDLFHRYVHNRFATPSPGELTAAWDHAQPLFEKIWP